MSKKYWKTIKKLLKKKLNRKKNFSSWKLINPTIEIFIHNPQKNKICSFWNWAKKRNEKKKVYLKFVHNTECMLHKSHHFILSQTISSIN